MIHTVSVILKWFIGPKLSKKKGLIVSSHPLRYSSVPYTFQYAGTAIAKCPFLVSLVLSSVLKQLLRGVPF